MEFIKFIKEALSSDNTTSSKRVCGFIGWIICLICVLYSVFVHKEAPSVVDTLFIASTSLLGLDSVVSIFKK